MAIKIAFYNRKGGTGKTTSTVNVAGELAVRGYSVLIVDTDPQANASSNLGRGDSDIISLSEVLLGDANVNDVIIPTDIENIDILPANLSLQEVEIKIMSSSTRHDNHLIKVMKNVTKEYDFILIDCSPNMGVMTVNALSYADYILIPTKTDKNSIQGFEKSIDTVKTIKDDCNENLEVLGVFLTVFEKATVIDKSIYENCQEQYGELFIETVIHKNTAVREAPFNNVPVNSYDKRSAGSKDYKALTDEILRRLEVRKNG